MRSEARLAHLAVRWTARILVAVLAITVVAILVDKGLPAVASISPSVVLQSIALLAIVVGLVAGWRWELAGGAVALFGTALFCTVEWFVTGRLPNAFVFALVALTAMLLLIAGWWHRTHPMTAAPRARL
ncbi:MAG: hypothetical protein U0V87_02705 [Acidobacteriota bacterium]